MYKRQTYKVESKTPENSSGGLVQTLLDSAKKAVTDTSTNDTVVDSFTGQVIQVDKPAAIGGTVKGGVKGSAAGYVNAGGSLIEGLGHLNTAIASKQDTAEINKLQQDNARYQQMLDTGRKLDGTVKMCIRDRPRERTSPWTGKKGL